MSQHPHAGGRYYRQKDGSLVRADPNAVEANDVAKPSAEAAAKPAKRDSMKDETNA